MTVKGERQLHYIVSGKVAPHAGNSAMVGRETYLTQLADGHFIWDGKHRMVFFERWNNALEAAMLANGPLWRMPAPDTIVITPVEKTGGIAPGFGYAYRVVLDS